MTPLLEFTELQCRYGRQMVLQDINLQVRTGEIVGIVGESGAGKSTLLRLALGLVPEGAEVAGSVRFRGKELLSGEPEALRQLRGRHLGMIFQNSREALCPVRRIGDQVAEYAREHVDLSKAEILKQAEGLLVKLNFKDPEEVLQSYPFELSGGMNQRVGIMQALLLQPEVLLADEPTGSLDVTTQKEILELLAKLRREQQMTMFLVAHSLFVVNFLADWLVVMKNGRIVESGTREDIMTVPKDEYTKALIKAAPRLVRKHYA